MVGPAVNPKSRGAVPVPTRVEAMDAMVYIENGLFQATYFMSDLLDLRLPTVTATCVLVTYFAPRPEP